MPGSRRSNTKATSSEDLLRSSDHPVVDKPLNVPHEGTGEPQVTRALKTRIDRAKSDEVFIDFDPGPSVDPSITVTRVGSKEPAGYIAGLNFYIPGTGAIYASGHTNNNFDTRTKYILQGDRFVEVKQPFYWVGLESKAKKDLVLCSGKDQKVAVAHVPKGSALTVVLNEGEHWYLIKETLRGLLLTRSEFRKAAEKLKAGNSTVLPGGGFQLHYQYPQFG